MFNFRKKDLKKDLQREKELIDREIELYRREQFLKIDEEARLRKSTNWQQVDDTRSNRLNKIRELDKEIYTLEGKRQALSEENQASKTLLASRNDEIQRLNTIISGLISKIPSQQVVINNDRK